MPYVHGGQYGLRLKVPDTTCGPYQPEVGSGAMVGQTGVVLLGAAL